MIKERRSIQLCMDYRTKIQKAKRKNKKLKKKRNKLLSKKRKEVIEIDQDWEIDNYIDQTALSSVVFIDTANSIASKEKKGSRLFQRHDYEHIEEFSRRLLKNEFKLTKESDYDYHFSVSEIHFLTLCKHYFYFLLGDLDVVRSLKYLTKLDQKSIEILKVLVKGKFTAAIVLKYFVKMGQNEIVKKFVFNHLFDDIEEILKTRNYFLKSQAIDIFREIFQGDITTHELTKILSIIDTVKINEFTSIQLYKLTDLRKSYDIQNLINSKFLRERVASFQFFIGKIFQLFIAIFKIHPAYSLTNSMLFFKTGIEFFNFHHLQRYEVYPGNNLFYQNVDINHFDFTNITPEILYSLLERAKGNFSYYLLRTILNHLTKKMKKKWKFELRKFGVALRLKWLNDLEFSVSSLNSYIKSDFKWLVSNSHKLDSKIWRMLKSDAEKSNYILNYIMEFNFSEKINFKYFDDIFEKYKPSPSKCDKSLVLMMRLKQQQLERTLKNLRKSYPKKPFSLVSKNLPYYSSTTQITSEKYYVRSNYNFLNFRNRKILKKGEMIQIDESNKVFFTFLKNNILVSITVYKSGNKICVRMEGTHKKRIFSSNYLEGEVVEKMNIDDTLVCKDYVLFQFSDYCSLYKMDLDSCKIVMKFPKKFDFKELKFLDRWGYLCAMGHQSICLYDVRSEKIKIVEDFGGLELLGLEENFKEEIVLNMNDKNQYKLKISRIEIF